ncbi:MAG: type III secretion system chaperone [Kiritimatiellae bacterium]|nr:type III secretion system chaperone [Kiritimatiellia bacterium]
MEFKKLMADFAAAARIDRIDPDEDGCYRFEIDGMVVTFSEVLESDELLTWAEAGELPPEGRETLYRTLLEALYMGRATGGSVLSVDPESGMVCLHRSDPLTAMDFERFKEALQKFVNVLEFWRRTLADFRPAAKEHAEAVQAEPGVEREIAFGNFMRV